MSFHFQVVNAYDLFDYDPQSEDDEDDVPLDQPLNPPNMGILTLNPNPDDFERVDEERNREMVWNGGEAVMDALARVCFLTCVFWK